MTGKKNGRPSKLTPEIVGRFLSAIRLGAPYLLACNYAGITYQTMLNWRERKEESFLQFFEDIKKAEGEAAIKWLQVLDDHSEADARWAAWKLERRYPGDFGRQEKITITSEDADKAIDAALAAHNLPKPETFAGEPMIDSEM
jgi:hypothetical protein